MFEETTKVTLGQVVELIEKLNDMLICSHLGTIESFDSPLSALYALLVYEQGVTEFFTRKEYDERPDGEV